jgi:hypothetical protein
VRIRVPVLAYLAALAVGSGVFAVTVAIMDISVGPFVLVLAFVAFVFGGVLALPVALPVIIVTERWGKGPWWLFLGAGGGASLPILAMMGLFGGTGEAGAALSILGFLLPTTISAAMTYWFVAWKRWGPEPDFSSTLEMFE